MTGKILPTILRSVKIGSSLLHKLKARVIHKKAQQDL